MTEQRDWGLLCARADELLARARAGEITVTHFLTPQEQGRLARHLSHARGEWLTEGGYPDAERRRILFLPDYIREAEEEWRAPLLADTLSELLCPLAIRGSGYAALTHRDYLGAVLNLGIERDAVGDICVLSPQEAVLFCDRRMADFLTASLTRVARDTVRASVIGLPTDFDGGRRFEALSLTVASPRADAVVAALCRLSRERAQALFAAALVEIDYEPEQKPDREVAEGAVLTVRGHGKFIVRSLTDKTKKGRYRLIADRYI
ncbi:MAG: hypothetical protein E7663_02085 [Ruminococcaceae bacterium]|nr:hypothetical protein [Oscillospiraceae bacterium]